MSRILSSATSLCAIVFAGATYFALRRPQGEVTRENLMLRLNYKNRALRNMSEEIGELGPRVPTEALYTMLSLAAFGAAKTLQPPPYREHEPPLEVAHDPDFYCRLPCEWAHLRALSHLLKQRGGLTAVNRPGFGVALQLCVLHVHSQYILLMTPQVRYPRLLPASSAAGFPALRIHEADDEFLAVS